MITKERAEEIRTKCRELATSGPWSDQMEHVVTPEEHAEITKMWESMPGSTSYVNAFYRFLNETAY